MSGSPPTIAAAAVNPLLVDLVIILLIAAVVSLVFHRLRLAAIPAYLVAGAIIGPGLLGLIPDAEHVASISQLAIVLLMFGIGLHTDTSEIRSRLVPIVGTGAIACVLLTALGTPIILAFGTTLPGALLISAAISMSSTAAVMRLLQQRRQLGDLHGRVAFGVLIVQDLYAVLVLAILPLLVAWNRLIAHTAGGGGGAPPIDPFAVGSRVAAAVLGIAVIILAGRLLLPRVLAVAGRDGGSELVLIVGAGAALGSAAATAALGFSPELGAFLAGFLLASTPARHQLMGQLAPVRDLFVPVFFVAVGLAVDLRVAADHWLIVVTALPLILMGKAVVIGIAAWALGMSGPVAVMSGIVLAQTGEFTLVVLGAGFSRGLVSPEAVAVLAMIVALSLMLTPTLFQCAPRLARAFVQVPPPPWRRRSMRDIGARHARGEPAVLRAIVAGFGPVGRELVNRLEQSGFACSIVELNPDTVKRQRGLGRRIVYGDAANLEVLREAGVERADAVLLTIPDHEAMLRACRLIRSLAPACFIGVRSGFLSRGMQATALGADYVVIDEIATAAMMTEQVCTRLGARISARDAVPADAGPATPGAS